MSLLEVRDLRVTYGGVVAVRDVSFSVEPGEVLAVLGANGAGKTTTLLAVSGLVRVRGGAVLLDGSSTVGVAPEQVARRGVAHVPAGRGLFPGLSVADNLRMGLYGAGRDGTEDGAVAVEEVLDTFPILREKRDQPAGTMSGGQQQQLAIARALVQRPRLLLLDEMSMGLAPAVVADLFALVADLRTRGIAVVMVEQFVGQTLAVADRAVVLEQGTVVAQGAPDELSSDDLAAAYLGGGSAPEVVVRPAPDRARERVRMSLRGEQVRRLEQLAAEQERPVEEVLEDLVRGALRGQLVKRALAVAAVLAPTAALLVAVRPVDAAPPVYDGFALSALVAGARTNGDVGNAGGLVTLQSGSGWVQAELDSGPSSFVRAAPYEPGPLTRTVVGQVNAGAGEQVLAVPDAEAAYPGTGKADLAAVPSQTVEPVSVGGGAATARAAEHSATGTSTGAAFGIAGVLTVDGSTSAVTLTGDVAAGTVVATARTSVGRVSVAGVLELRDVVATAAVRAAGDAHRAEAHLSIGSMSVAGQEVGLTDEGLVAAGTPLIPGTTLQQATAAANAVLAGAGITVDLTAAVRRSGPREAAADTGGVRISVASPDLPGGVGANSLEVVVGGASLAETDTLAAPPVDVGSGPVVPPVQPRPPATTTTVVTPGTPGIPGTAGAPVQQPPAIAPEVAPAAYEVVGRRLSGPAVLAAFGVWQFLTLASVSLYALIDRRRRLALLEADR